MALSVMKLRRLLSIKLLLDISIFLLLRFSILAEMIIFEGIVGHGHILISVIMPKFAAFLAAHLPSIGSVTVSDV